MRKPAHFLPPSAPFRGQADGTLVRRMARALSRFWQYLWRGKPPHLLILLLALAAAAIMAVPILYVFIHGWEAGWERWSKLLDDRIPMLLWNTLTLTLTVTVSAILIGVTLAFLINRTDLPGRRVWRWIAALPLVIPPYVGAMCYIIVFGPAGWLRDWLGEAPFQLYGFPGAAGVLTMFTYPYVYLIAGASLRRMNVHFEEVGRSCGLSYRMVFLKVVLPLLRPAMGAGGILVALYVLSDFGAVAMMRYTTFTAAIYYQMGSFDRTSAAILSVVLIAITMAVLWLEWRSRRNLRYDQNSKSYRPTEPVSLGPWKWFAFTWVLLITSLSVLLPVTVLIYWSSMGVQTGALGPEFWEYALNSLMVSGAAAGICLFLSVPVVYLKSRNPSAVSEGIDKIVYGSYALPGVIVALGVVFVFHRFFPALYGTLALLIVAYVIRFLPQATQAGEAAFNLVSPRLEEAAQSLGHPPWKTVWKVTVPLVLPGVLAGAAMVFVSSLKELPATLLLRPAGYDTLSVRIWIQASEGIYHMAAPAALFILLVSVLPLRWMLNKY